MIAAGPMFLATAAVLLYQPPDEETPHGIWAEQREPGSAISTQDIRRYKIFVRVRVTNTGRSTGRVESFGLRTTSSGDSVDVDSPRCSFQENRWRDCSLPTLIETQKTYTVYLPIDDVESSLTCEQYVIENGLTVEVRHLYGEPTIAETKVMVPYANDCQVGPPPAPEG